MLGGRKIEILIEDDESNPTAGVAAARKLLDVSEGQRDHWRAE